MDRPIGQRHSRRTRPEAAKRTNRPITDETLLRPRSRPGHTGPAKPDGHDHGGQTTRQQTPTDEPPRPPMDRPSGRRHSRRTRPRRPNGPDRPPTGDGPPPQSRPHRTSQTRRTRPEAAKRTGRPPTDDNDDDRGPGHTGHAKTDGHDLKRPNGPNGPTDEPPPRQPARPPRPPVNRKGTGNRRQRRARAHPTDGDPRRNRRTRTRPSPDPATSDLGRPTGPIDDNGIETNLGDLQADLRYGRPSGAAKATKRPPRGGPLQPQPAWPIGASQA
jgi:hypothetical protein